MNKFHRLAAHGLRVIPCNPETKAPYTPRGVHDATTDRQTINEWVADWPDAVPGVACGASGIIVLDIDAKPHVNGWRSLIDSPHEAPPTLSYTTKSGGTHLIYASPEGAGDDLRHSQNYLGMEAVDRRSGRSYAIWWGHVPDVLTLTNAPEWLTAPLAPKPTPTTTVDVAEWERTLGAGEPDALMRDASLFIQGDDFGRAQLYTRLVHIIRLANEGHPGGAWAIAQLHAEWTRPPWNAPGPEREFATSLTNAIAANAFAGDATAPEPHPTEPTGRLRIITRTELRAIPRPQWWVEGLIAQSTIAAVAGQPGIGKTFLVTDLLACIATGTPWHEHATIRGRVLYIPGEGLEFYEDRLEAWERHNGITIPEDALRLVPEGFNLSQPEAVATLAGWVADGEADVVCIDTLSQLSDLDDENDNAQMARTLRAALAIRQARPGATVIIVHHVSKADRPTVRGASAFSGNVDTIIIAKRDREGHGFTVTTEGPTGKQKNAPPTTIDGLSLASVGRSAVVTRALEFNPYRTAILEALQEGPATMNQLRDRFPASTEWSERLMQRKLADLIDSGLVMREGANRWSVYRLTLSARTPG